MLNVQLQRLAEVFINLKLFFFLKNLVTNFCIFNWINTKKSLTEAEAVI